MAEQFHIKLRFKGKEEELKLFNAIAGKLDRDWPVGLERPKCPICDGVRYQRPLFKAKDIKALGRQLGLRKIVIQHFLPEELCMKKASEKGLVRK